MCLTVLGAQGPVPWVTSGSAVLRCSALCHRMPRHGRGLAECQLSSGSPSYQGGGAQPCPESVPTVTLGTAGFVWVGRGWASSLARAGGGGPLRTTCPRQSLRCAEDREPQEEGPPRACTQQLEETRNFRDLARRLSVLAALPEAIAVTGEGRRGAAVHLKQLQGSLLPREDWTTPHLLGYQHGAFAPDLGIRKLRRRCFVVISSLS